MMETLRALLGVWSRVAQAMPWRAGLFGIALAGLLLGFLSAMSRARFELRTQRVSTGPIFALSGLFILLLSLIIALVDAALAAADMMLVEERALLLLASGEGQEAYAALREALALVQGGRFVLPGPVHVPLALLFFGAIYLLIVWWAARTLEEMVALEQKPDDVLARERAEHEKAIKKAIAEGRQVPQQAVESVPLSDDLLGRMYKLLGHWTSVEFVEERFVRWQRPLVAALSSLLVLALPAALGGHFPAPLWVGAAIALDGLRKNLGTRTKPPEPPAKEAPPKEPAAPRPELLPLLEAIHRSAGPLLLPPEVRPPAPAQISPGTALSAKRVLGDLSRALGLEDGLYVHQGLSCDAFAARKNVLLCTPPLSGKATLADLLVFYALLVEAENVLWIAADEEAARAMQQRFLERAQASRWQWNVHAALLAGRAAAVDVAHTQPGIVFADPAGLSRELCGRQREWSGYLGTLGLCVVPDLSAWDGVRGAHLGHLVRRLRRAVARAAPAAPRGEGGERLRFLATADPSYRDLGRFAERIMGRPFHVLGPEVDGAPEPARAVYFLPPTAPAAGDLHPAVRALGEALSHGLSAELFGYEDTLARADVTRANELMLGRGVATRGRAFAEALGVVTAALAQAEVVIARADAARYASLPLLAAHLGMRAGAVQKARVAALGAGERVGKAMAAPAPKPEEPKEKPEGAGEVSEEALKKADLERKTLILWQPDLDPFSALLARERPYFRHPDLLLGRALVADPSAEAIQRVHLRAALTEGELSEEELLQDYARPVVESELAAARGEGAGEGETADSSLRADGDARLGTRARFVVDPASGALREVPVYALVGGEAHAGIAMDAAGAPATVVDRHTGEVLFGVERARMLGAAYPGRIVVLHGRRFSVLPLPEQDGIEAGRVACEREERPLSTSRIRELSVRAEERRKSERRREPREGQERRVEPRRSLGGADFLLEHRPIEVEEVVLGLRHHGPDGLLRDTTLYAEPVTNHFATRAAILGFPAGAFGALSEGALHALTHLFRVTLPAFVAHREEDLDVVWLPRFGPSEAPSIAFVDLHPGGVGFAEAITMDVLRMAVTWSLAIVDRCPAGCQAAAGCPRCLQIAQCHAAPGREGILDKRGARDVLVKMLGREEKGAATRADGAAVVEAQ